MGCKYDGGGGGGVNIVVANILMTEGIALVCYQLRIVRSEVV